jgi:hypothetical protein
LLNFFIALVGDAYDKVVSQSEERQYARMARVNRECNAFYQFLGRLNPIDCYILQTRARGVIQETKDESELESSGITKRFQKNLKEETKKVKDDIAQCVKEAFSEFKRNQEYARI